MKLDRVDPRRSSAENMLGDESFVVGSIVYCEASDLIFWLKDFLHPTGIQRVQIELLLRLIVQDDLDIQYVMAFRQPGLHDVFAVPQDEAMQLLEYVTSGTVTRAGLDLLIEEIEHAAELANLVPGDALVLLGAFWLFPSTIRLVQELRWKGVKIGLFVYDLIPIRNPEYCEVNLVRAFRNIMTDIGPFLNFAFGISDFVAKDYAEFRSEIGQPKIDVTAVPLAIESELHRGVGAVRQSVRDAVGSRFAIQVGTLEARKNPRFAAEVWKQLILEQTPDMPKLIYAGRRGWRTDDFLDELAATNFMDGQVVIMNDLSDSELAFLYRSAMFTLFPSFTEGWGLPLAESLANGVPCLTSRCASMPEIAGELAEYIDPLNVRSGVAAVRRLLDPAYLNERRTQLRSDLITRSWHDVFVTFSTAMKREIVKDVAKSFEVPSVPAGKIISMGVKDREYAWSISLGLSVPCSGWYELEDWGCWGRTSQTRIQFKTDLMVSTRVYLILRSSPTMTLNEVEILSKTGMSLARRKIYWPSSTMVMAATCLPDENGVVELVIKTLGNIEAVGGDPRALFVGFEAIAHAPSDDLAKRRDIEEDLSFGAHLVPSAIVRTI